MKKLIALLLIFLPFSAVGSSSSFLSKVRSVYPLGSGTVILTFETPSESCTDPNGYFRVTDGQNGMTTSGIKNIMSAALTAGASNKDVHVVFDPTTSKCYINRLSVRFF